MNTFNDNREGGLNNCTQKNSLMPLETLKNVRFRLLIMPAFELGYNLPSLLYFCRSGTIKKIYGKMAAVFRLIILPAFELGNIFLQANNVGPTLIVVFLPLWENAFNIFL